ncbi:MAG TPA: MlaD family protein [Thermoleophilaceae bacterium]|jgi:ABC-type transporter Mla subunit MlaD
MRRLLALIALACAGSALLVLGGASGGAGGKRYRVVFDNAFGLVSGGDLKIGGVRAGKIVGFQLSSLRSPKAVVEVEVTQPGFDDLRSDASCEIRPQSLIGEYYVDCQPGSSRRALPNDVVPVEHTSSGIPLDLVNDVMRRPYRERLRLILTELGTGLAGRPRDLSEVLRRAHPGLRETNRVLEILGRQNRTIASFIRDADTVVGQLERRKADVARFVTKAGDAAEISAGRRSELRLALARLPGFLDELRPTMARLGGLADEQVPLLRGVRTAAPALDLLLARVGPFAAASRKALHALGPASAAGRRAFARGRQEVGVLRRLAPDAPPTLKPLRQLLQTLDDRRRAHVSDPLARSSAPPPPDPTAIPARAQGGFTGFEAIANYLFWQALSINRFDSIGHVLSIVGLTNDCANYETGPVDSSNADLFRRCNQWLGPYQPGVNAPDPTKTAGETSAPRLGRTPARRVGERRGTGQPEAGPLPGQHDISKPDPPLLPALKRLLPALTRRQVRRPARGAPSSSSALLDYLLSP